MRYFDRSVIFFCALLLGACAGDKDNSVPPSPLTRIENPLVLYQNWHRDTRASENSASYRLRPLLLGDFIYSVDTRGRVVCINAASGRRLWRFDTGLSSITGLGGDEENLIVSSRDGDIASYRVVERGLQLRWNTKVNSEIRATPVYDDGQVFVRSVDGRLRSLSAVDGTQQWQVSRRVPTLSLTGNSEPLVDALAVYAGFDDGRLIAFDRSDGQIRWESTISQPRGRTEVERLVDLDGRFVLRDGIIYISSFQGRLAAVQAVSGDLLWSRQFSSFQAIEVDSEALYLSDEGSDIWSIDRRTGSAFWKQDVLHARKITAPLIFEDKIVVADFDGYLHWLDKRDGKLVGRIRTTEERNYVQPLAWQQSVLTFDQNGHLTSVSHRR